MDNIKLNIETNAEIAIQVLTFYRSLKDHPQHPQYYLHDQMRVQNSPRKRGPGRPPKKGTNVPKRGPGRPPKKRGPGRPPKPKNEQPFKKRSPTDYG